MLKTPTYLKIVRVSAWYDLVVTGLFVTPWTFLMLLEVLRGVDGALGLPGDIAQPEPMLVLLGNLLGSVVVVWAVLRLRLNRPDLGRYDMVARFLFAAWQLNAVLSGASWLVLGFFAMEVAFGIAQALPYGTRARVAV